MLKLKSQTVKSFFIFSFVLASLYGAASFAAMDCPGGQWRNGPKCSEMGLDTHRGICKPGSMYEILCDDRRGSDGRTQNITCQGSQRCYNPPHNDYNDYNDYDDDNNYNDHNDYNNYSCYEWDFNRQRPCRPGFENRDCYGGCERRRY